MVDHLYQGFNLSAPKELSQMEDQPEATFSPPPVRREIENWNQS
jgi:hypothetical protein